MAFQYANEVLRASAGKGIMTTANNERYELFNATEISANLSINQSDINCLGSNFVQHAQRSMSGSGSMSIYWNTSIFQKMAQEYKDTGIFPDFDLYLVNEDFRTSVGKHGVILKHCKLNSVSLSNMAVGDDDLITETDFTFDDFELTDTFTDLQGFKM